MKFSEKIKNVTDRWHAVLSCDVGDTPEMNAGNHHGVAIAPPKAIRGTFTPEAVSLAITSKCLLTRAPAIDYLNVPDHKFRCFDNKDAFLDLRQQDGAGYTEFPCRFPDVVLQCDALAEMVEPLDRPGDILGGWYRETARAFPRLHPWDQTQSRSR